MNIAGNPADALRNDAWRQFADYTDQKGVSDRTIIKASQFDNLDGAQNNSGLELSRSTTDSVWKLWRSSDLKNANNVTRQIFKEAVFSHFGLDANDPAAENMLPAGVKDAMRLGDFNGKGKPLTIRQIKTVKAAVEKWESEKRLLEGCQSRIDKIFQGDGYARAVIKGAQEHNGVGNSLPKTNNKYFLKDKPLQIPYHGVSRNSFEGALDDQFSKLGPEGFDKGEKKLRKALAAFCTDEAFRFGVSKSFKGEDLKDAFGTKIEFPGGKMPIGSPSDVSNQVKVVKAKDGNGYDIIVQQKFSNLKGLQDANGKREFFDPEKPASCTVSYTYHLEMGADKPIVSIKKMPTAKFKNNKPIGEEAFVQRVKDLAGKTHRNQVYAHWNATTHEWWKDELTDRMEESDDVFNAYIQNELIDGDGKLSYKELARYYNTYAELESSEEGLNKWDLIPKWGKKEI